MRLLKAKTVFDNFSLKYKLLLIVFIGCFFIFFAASLGLGIFFKVSNARLFRAVSGNLSFSSQAIADVLKSVETMSSTAISSSSIQNSLNTIDRTDDSIARFNANRQLNLTISSYQQTYKQEGVKCILLYNHSFYNTTDFSVIRKLDSDTLQELLKSTREKDGAVCWMIDHEENIAVLGRSVRRISNLNLSHLGDLLIFLDMNKIVSDATKAITTYEDAKYILYNGQQLLYASSGITRNTAAKFLNETDSSSYHILRHEGHSYFTVSTQIPYYGWTYISLIPYDQISASINIILFLIVFLLFLALFLSLILAHRMTRYVLRDFDILIQKMELFSRGLELPPAEVDYSCRTDEISRLHQHFDTMVQRIQELIRKNYINEILSRDSRLKALEAQINPHFLYNTLETINWRAKAAGDGIISQMAESLGALLRASLSIKKPLATFSYELELVESYMTIQKIRFEDRLAYQVHVDEMAIQGLIPPLTLQPLIENAIHYGMEEMTEVCHIYLEAQVEDNILFVRVKNEGSYFEEDLLDKLRSKQRKPHGFGIGLLNIDQRIKLLFGTEYGLSFYNEKHMAVAAICLPFQKERT